jgi:hypothetical protein
MFANMLDAGMMVGLVTKLTILIVARTQNAITLNRKKAQINATSALVDLLIFEILLLLLKKIIKKKNKIIFSTFIILILFKCKDTSFNFLFF